MVTTAEKDAVLDQTLNLCRTILDQPEFVLHTEKIEKFLADDKAKEVYMSVTERGQELHQMQHQGVEIAEDDARAFGDLREGMMANPVISDFLEAQDALNSTHQKISTYVAKTLELGRIPSEEDLQQGGCCGGGGGGGGCGCD